MKKMLRKITQNYKGVNYSNIKGGRYFRCNYQNSRKLDKQLVKHYSLKKLGARKALKFAVEQRKEWENKYGKTSKRPITPKYNNEIIKKEDYFVLKIVDTRDNEFLELKISYSKLDKIKKYHWIFDKKYRRVKGTHKEEGGSVQLSSYLFPHDTLVVNHLNRDRFDFRDDNIVFDTACKLIKPSVWDDEMIEELKELADKYTMKEIAKKMGKSYGAISGACTRFNVDPIKKPLVKKRGDNKYVSYHWSDKQEEMLDQLYNKGLEDEEIAEKLNKEFNVNRTVGAITNKRYKIGLY